MTRDQLNQHRLVIAGTIAHSARILIPPGMKIAFVFPVCQEDDNLVRFSAMYAEDEHSFVVNANLPFACEFHDIIIAVEKCVQAVFKMRMNVAVEALQGV